MIIKAHLGSNEWIFKSGYQSIRHGYGQPRGGGAFPPVVPTYGGVFEVTEHAADPSREVYFHCYKDNGDSECFIIHGDEFYIMNENGKTIERI